MPPKLAAVAVPAQRTTHNKLDLGYSGFRGGKMGGAVEAAEVPDAVLEAARDGVPITGEAGSPSALLRLKHRLDMMPPTGVAVTQANGGMRLIVRPAPSVYDAAWKSKITKWMSSRNDKEAVRWHDVDQYHAFHGELVFPQIFFVGFKK
jgi:hypothetical protein